ncbi:MAG: hypothetical protein K1W15_13010 [Lachnospiraceae bacterium]|jgi:hypothetical protein
MYFFKEKAGLILSWFVISMLLAACGGSKGKTIIPAELEYIPEGYNQPASLLPPYL